MGCIHGLRAITDTRVSLHRSDNLFGTLEPREDDISVELNINTLARILKVTQFNPHRQLGSLQRFRL